MEPNATCELCQCNGNIDMRDPEACDIQTGACLSCINNSTGPRCEQCRDWWYGDAVVEKDCYRKFSISIFLHLILKNFTLDICITCLPK